VQLDFIQQMHRIMNFNSTLVMVTDDDDYSKWMVRVLKEHNSFDSKSHTTEWEGYGNSYFEQLWREKGKTIQYHQYIKTNA
jgi:tRNA (guanine-N7-)-methyltransferase